MGRVLLSLAFPVPFQTLHLVMQVLLLNCGLQQILARDLTRGGLLSFLLFQEDVGRYVQVSQEPGRAPFLPPPFFLSSGS